VDYRILGPLEVIDAGRRVNLGGGKQRALLAVLLLHPNEVVSVDRLVDELWGEIPPATAGKLVQGYVSGLRKALGSVLVTRPPGYLARVNEGELDLSRAVRLAEEAREAASAGELGRGSALLSRALALWRGMPLGDVELQGAAASESERLAELRLTLALDKSELDLALGRHADLIGELETLVARHPYQERLRGQLMLALYRSGRQAEALDVYRETRRRLADELGLEPSAALRELEAAILAHDPSLDLPRSATTPAAALADSTPRSAPTARPNEERKFATILFADIVDSTALGEQEDPEVVRALVTREFERLAVVVESHGGTLEKFIGDAILAVFGVPVAHEDDPERAVRAALEMQTRLESGTSLSLRIGIEAGEILADLGRVESSRDRMLTGDAVNVAARIQQRADPGSVLVGPVVHAATRHAVEYREHPALDVRGKSQPVPAWEAVRVRTARGERAKLGLEAPLVGRDNELSLLERTFEWVRSEQRPALATILGNAGVGKSRLAQELCRRLEEGNEAVRVLQGRCLSYGNVSYSALAEAVKSECEIQEDDAPGAVAEKIARTAGQLSGHREVTPHLQALVGAGDMPNMAREDLFDGWRRFLEQIAARSPLVLVLEDIHWGDDGLLDFVDHLADWAQGPLLVLTLARPELLESRPGWGGGKRNYSAIYLEPLAPDETRLVLDNLVSGRLPEGLARTVVEHSEGNPLFTEEIVRMLIDRGVLRQTGGTRWEVTRGSAEIEIPRSIQGLISARIDSLPAREKAMLQDASVVGRTFWLGAVARLAGGSVGEAREVLSGLRIKQIVLPREPPVFSGEQELMFRHVLIRDVAYESLPKSLRAEKHVATARWAEHEAGGRREEIAELLAAHYAHALGYLDELGIRGSTRDAAEQEGLRWSRAAGARALRLWQQDEAVRWLRIAVDLAERVGLPNDERATLLEAYATAGEEAIPYRDVAGALETALALFDQLGRESDAGRVEAHLAYIAQQSGELDEVLPWATRALARLEPLGDSRDLGVALHVLGWHEFRSVRFEEAEIHLRRALEIATHVGDMVVRAHVLVSLAFVYQQTQRGDESLTLFEDALKLARDADDLSLLLRVLVHIEGALEEFRGDYRRAIELAEEGLELARRAGNTANVAWTTQMLSDLLLDLGELDESEEWTLQALDAGRAVGDALVVGYSLERIAYLHALRGDPDAAERVLAEVRPILADNPEPWLQGWAPLIAGHIAQGRGNDDGAADLLADGARPLIGRILVWGGRNLLLECVRSLVRAGRAGDARPFRDRLATLAKTSVPARAMLAWADGLLAAEPITARELLVGATDQFEALGNRLELGRCLLDIADAERLVGMDASSTTTRAKEILESCGAHLFLRELDPDALDGTTRPPVSR
jgi:class 3 adenylate cyclase/tetratricopeptide (TPR) repeat protein